MDREIQHVPAGQPLQQGHGDAAPGGVQEECQNEQDEHPQRDPERGQVGVRPQPP